MPAILVKEYNWRQTYDTIFINTPIIGNPKNVDLLAINNYVKASYPPFIFELFLWGTILDEESECILDKGKGEVIFRLRKKETDITWPSLVIEDLDRERKNDLRAKASEEAKRLIEKREKLKNGIESDLNKFKYDKIAKLQKQAVKAQINLDTAVLNSIDMIRDTERKEAMKDLEDWKLSNKDYPILSGIEGKLQDNRKAYRPALKWFKDDKGELKSREITRAELTNDKNGITNENENLLASNPQNFNEIGSSDEIINSTSGSSTIKDQIDNSESNNTSNLTLEKNRSSDIVFDSFCSSSEDNDDDDDNDDCEVKINCDSTTKAFVKKLNARRAKKIFNKKKINERNSTIIKTRSCSKDDSIFDEAKRVVVPLPLPRKNGIIEVKFSERKFPTPARESNQLQEQEWLEKQAEARRQTGFIVEDLRPEELDPQWLKDKGDEFFKAGNYLGAISAYTHGIKLSPKMSSLYSNRSAAHYAIGNYSRCTEDCSEALELMIPECKGNLESRAKCHARRGAALCKLSSPQHGIPELEAALKLDPDNQTVKRDLQAARQYFGMHE